MTYMDDLTTQIDQEKARAKQKKLEEQAKQAAEAAEKAQKANKDSNSALLF